MFSGCCNIEQLENKLHDINLKYEALENKYKTTKLENCEYAKQIDELEQQNEELKFALESNQKRMTEELQAFSPILEIANRTMESIEEDESQISELKDKLNQYEKSMQLLQSENINLRQESDKFRTVLEVNNKQKEMQKIILVSKNRTIDSLKVQIHELRDELQTVQSVQYAAPKTPKTPNTFPDTRVPSDTLLLHVPFMKTIDGSNNCLQFSSTFDSNTISASFDTDNPLFAYMNSDKSDLGSIDENSTCTRNVYENNTMNDHELKSRLDKLMVDNQELMKQIDILENNKTECKYVEEIDEKHEVNIEEELEFNEDDMFEMEQLFWKCEAEMMRNGYNVYQKVRDHKHRKRQ
eukprot:39966_1